MSTPPSTGGAEVVTTETAAVPSTSSSSSSPSSLVVHHLQDSRSQRILWLLEELNVPYSIQKYKRTSGGLAPPELYAVHPLGKSPVISDGGRVVAESGVIVDYLIRHYGPAFSPSTTDEEELLSVSYWSQMAEGSVMGPLVMMRVFNTVETQAPWIVRPVAKAISAQVNKSYLHPTLKAQFDFIERHLSQQKSAGSEFFCSSHLTSADVMMMFPLEAACDRATFLVGDNVRQYVQRMHQRPAYKRGLEKGGEYAYAKM